MSPPLLDDEPSALASSEETSSDIEMVAWEQITPERRLGLTEALVKLTHTHMAMWAAVIALGVIGLSATGVLVGAFYADKDIPAWAPATVSSIITAAVALVFNHRGRT